MAYTVRKDIAYICFWHLNMNTVVVTKQDGYTNVPKRSEIILIVVGAVTTLRALTSLFGYASSPFVSS